MKQKSLYLLLFFLFTINISFSQNEKENDKEELAKLNRELDNPLAKYWSLVLQENFSINQGDAVDGSVSSNTTPTPAVIAVT